jgi:tetratricopeptide (TPR) repeat protein
MPPVFLERTGIAWNEAGRAVATAIEWERADIVTADGITLPTGIEATHILGPGDRVVFSGVLRKQADNGPFRLGEHRLTLDLQGAVRTLQSPPGVEWNGRYVENGDVTIRFVEPRNAADRRRKRMQDAARAMAQDDVTAALADYLQAIRDDPTDINAHAGAGQAYMLLGRFREAVAELEQVLPHRRSERSLVPVWLAFSYLSMNDNAKAEAVLTSVYGTEAARRELEVLQAAARRGVR